MVWHQVLKGPIAWLKVINKIRTNRHSMLINPHRIFDFIERGTLRDNIGAEELEGRLPYAREFRDEISSTLNVYGVRIGREGDGGYIVPNMEFNTVVSIGIGYETSFEVDSALMNSRILMFDHTITPPKYLPTNTSFYPKGIGISDTSDLLSFDSILQISDLDSSKANLLKIDIEGYEYTTLTNANFVNFEVVIIELHFLEKVFYSNEYELFIKLMENLRDKHEIWHCHSNNWGNIFNIGNIVLPDVLEITFIKRESSQEKFAADLQARDYPCRSGFPEVWPLG